MTKLLVRDDFCLVRGECVPAHDWYSPLEIARTIIDSLFSEQAIIATDRYTLDVEHERQRYIVMGRHEYDLTHPTGDNAVDWHDLAQQHPIEPTSSSDDIVIGG